MRKLYIFMLLCCLAITQGAWAQETLTLFDETFDTNNGTGGKGKNGATTQYSASVASKVPYYDNDGWSGTNENKIYGGYQCIKFGAGSGSNKVNGICTTPDISYVSASNTITLTFEAVGWASGTNTLAVTATGATLSGNTDITLQNGEDKLEDDNSKWKSYTVTITPTASTFTLTFTGHRGFLDNVKVVETVNNVPAPTLTDDFLFWPNTTEAPMALFHLSPSSLTTVYYTTDGSTPTTSSPNIVTMASNIKVTGTTTIKAKAYVGSVSSDVVTKTYTVGSTVTGLTAFKALSEGTEARLLLTSESNTRITFASSQQAYLRDDSGVLCIDFGATATPNPTPATQQHVAGWIVGKKQTVNGRPTLVATTNTNTHYLALADRRNEAIVEPVAITADALNSNIGNWVTVDELLVVNTENAFVLTTAQPYPGAIVDVTGIVTATNTIAPTEAITFVIDEDEAFVSPGTDITGATVRLKRTLKEGIWNTFCVPMDLAISGDMAGKYRQCNSISGNVMTFGEATSIEAGKPYLIKPDAEIANKVFSNVTLSATPAATVQQGVSGLAFIGTYSPKELKTDKTEQFLTASGKLAYPSSSTNATLKGMRAYFYVPKGTEARVSIDGEEITALTLVNSGKRIVNSEVYDLQGRKVANPTKGMYIANGQKVIIK